MSDAQVSRTDLRRQAARGGLVSLCAQGVKFLIRTGSLLVLARLVAPEDFGLVGMAAVIVGFLALFKDLGLAPAAVQHPSITSAQMSTLFWINLGMGALLTIVAIALAPAISLFYREPRLFWVTVALGIGAFFSGASAQHQALLQRNMRFAALSMLEIGSLLFSTAISIGMATAGLGYWALVTLAVMPVGATAVGTWLVSGWVPGVPRRGSGLRSLLRFGGTLPINGVVVYIAYNTEKILLGRFWGAETLGVYGRGYQLISLPTETLNSAVGPVAFPALARIQHNPERLRRYYLRAYGLFTSVIIPVTVACVLYAEDIVHVFLGSTWRETVPVFRLLAPTIVAFGLINPFSWLLMATGQAGRSLKIALLIAPVVLIGYLVGVAYGPLGVAAGNSVAMVLLITPVILWAKHGTAITTVDIARTLAYPFAAVLIVGATIITDQNA